MTQQEAKEQMRQIWLNLPEGRINGMDRGNKNFGLMFYCYIEKRSAQLLNFRHSSDKYHLVKGWVNEWQRYLNL